MVITSTREGGKMKDASGRFACSVVGFVLLLLVGCGLLAEEQAPPPPPPPPAGPAQVTITNNSGQVACRVVTRPVGTEQWGAPIAENLAIGAAITTPLEEGQWQIGGQDCSGVSFVVINSMVYAGRPADLEFIDNPGPSEADAIYADPAHFQLLEIGAPHMGATGLDMQFIREQDCDSGLSTPELTAFCRGNCFYVEPDDLSELCRHNCYGINDPDLKAECEAL
jgi:hypothetical protein